jgi:hypothetical protein
MTLIAITVPYSSTLLFAIFMVYLISDVLIGNYEVHFRTFRFLYY